MLSLVDSTAPSVQIGDILASKYRVERVLGQGGMGVVVAARHEQLGFPVALKFMLPAALHNEAAKERFLREARAAGRLRGEHVARVMDFGTLDNGAPYIVMEFLEGTDLQGVLAQAGRLAPHEAVEYVLQACKAMDEAHGQGIVHRDLKPQNLFLTRRPDGTPLVKVLDFGISKVVEGEQALSMTSTSAIMGSPLYMAPEQIRSAKNVDARSDIYSLGVILYQLMSGALPVEAETLGELFERVFTQSIPPLGARVPEVAPDLEAVVMRCLAKDPAGRFPSIAQLAAALRPFTDARLSQSGFRGEAMAASQPPMGPSPAQSPSTTLAHAAAVSDWHRQRGTGGRGLPAAARWGAIAAVAVVLVAGGGLAVRARSLRAASSSAPAVSTAGSPASPSAPSPPSAAVAVAMPTVSASDAPPAASSASIAASVEAAPSTPPPTHRIAASSARPVAPAASAMPSSKPRWTGKPGTSADPFNTPE
jgi:serine/threonine protein kinase